jgi:hypothetical protein
MPSPEALRANEELLERMSKLDSSSFDPKLRVLSGKSAPNPSNHPDSRMNKTLADMAGSYNPPQRTTLGVIALTTKCTHKSQAESEKG